MRLTDFLSGPASRQVQYFPDLVPILGSVTATILFGQLLYWSGKGSDQEGWVYKSQADITKETALTREEQESARKKLRDAGVLREKKKGIPCRLWFFLDLNKVNELWEKNQQYSQYEGKPQTSMGDSRKQACGKAADKSEGKPQATTLDYAGDYQDTTAAEPKTAAADLQSNHHLPTPPEILEAIELLPPTARPECLVVASDRLNLPTEVLTSNIRLLASRLVSAKAKDIDNPGGWLINALLADYAAQERQSQAEVEVAKEQAAQRRQEAAEREERERQAELRRQAQLLVLFDQLPAAEREQISSEAQEYCRGFGGESPQVVQARALDMMAERFF